MKIKTEVVDKVEKYVAENWPEKLVDSNYKNNSSHKREEYRYIQVSSPIVDDYIHYEIINDHVALHFEFSGSRESGIEAHADLVDYLERVTESDNMYVWTSFLDGDSVACIYQSKIIDCDDMLEKLKIVIARFDELIINYQNQSKSIVGSSVIDVDHSISMPTESVDMVDLNLKEMFRKNLIIPSYQRIYCWDEKNVKCLLYDLLQYSEQHHGINTPYRLGAIILHCHDNQYDIIDGQQRLVTLALLLAELGVDTCLLNQEFDSSVAREYISYNKFLISNFVGKHIYDKKDFLNSLLLGIEFSVLTLHNTSIDLAYTFFSNENSRGVSLTDYDLLKAHHLRFIPNTFEQQSKKAAENWNNMIKRGKASVTEYEPIPDYERTLDTYLFNLRQWMRMEHRETKENDRHVKNEYEAAPIMPELPPFGEQFFFNEPIQGGTHFFSFVDIHLAKYKQFTKTQPYRSIHNKFPGDNSMQWYRNAIETLLFGYYLKFGEHCLADASLLILRALLQNRYETTRAQKDSIYKYVSELGLIMMIDRATSPTFFLAEAFNIIRDYPIKYLYQMLPIQRTMRRYVIEIKNELSGQIYVEAIKNIKL